LNINIVDIYRKKSWKATSSRFKRSTKTDGTENAVCRCISTPRKETREESIVFLDKEKRGDFAMKLVVFLFLIFLVKIKKNGEE